MPLVISETSIANSALTKIGSEQISSVDDDTKRARLCKLRLSSLRNEVLGAHTWRFARKRVEIASSVEPDFGWSAGFLLPTDYIRMVQDPLELDLVCDYIVEGRYILANEDPIKILYIFEESNYGNWDYTAAEALAWRLAADIAYPIAQSRELGVTMMQGYEKLIKEARFKDSSNQPLHGLSTETWITARN